MSRSTAIAHAGALALPRSALSDHRQKHLPVPAAAARVWVLHKDLVLKAGTIGLALLLVAGAIQMRGVAFDAAARVVEAASTGMASPQPPSRRCRRSPASRAAR